MAKKSDFNTSRSVKDLQAEYGKMPPQAVDLEEAVLGALMLERDAFSIVGDLLEPDAFYKDAHQKIFRAIHKLFLNDDPVDLLTVSEALKQSGELEQVGGYYYLSQLTTRVASAAHIEFHAKIIVQKYLQRKLIGVCTELQEMAYDEATDVSDLMDKAQKAVFDIADGNIKKDTAEIAPIIDEAIKGIQAAAEKPDGISGLPSGFNALDAVTSGWQPSDLVIIAARPAMGKTAFVLSMARNMAVKHHQAVAIFSLEMSAVQLVNRLIASETELSAEKGFGGGSHPGGRYPGFVYLRIAGQVPAIETEIWNKSIDYRLSAVDDRRCRYAGKPGTGSEFDFKAAENYCQGIEYSCYGFVPVEPWGRIPAG